MQGRKHWITSVFVFMLSLAASGDAHAGTAKSTTVVLKFNLCDPWSAPEDFVGCYAPHSITNTTILIRRKGSNKAVRYRVDKHGFVKAKLQQGIYQIALPLNQQACVAGELNGCRYYEFDSFHDVDYFDSYGPGRTLGIQGKLRRAVINFYERFPV